MLKLSKPYIPSRTAGLIDKVLQSGNLVQGENVFDFEKKLADYLNIDHVVMVSSGTAALHIALIALNIQEGDEVIVPAYSFPAVANAVELTGANCVFADITLDDYCIDVNKIEGLINHKTKAIMPVHEFGQAASMETILALAKKYNLYVLEDAACAIGTKYNDKLAGTIGDLGCFSFHPRKILTTGEGGAIATSNPELAEKFRQLRNHGMHTSHGITDFVLPGFNYRMTDFQAAMGLAQLSDLDETITIHKNQASFYHSKLKGIAGIHTDMSFENRCQTYQTYHIVFDSNEQRDYIKKELFQLGIESNIGAYAIPVQSYYQKKYNLDAAQFKTSVKAFRCGLALPIGRHLSEENLEYITESVLKLIKDGF